MSKHNGCVLWEGKSLIDGSPIVILLTALTVPSANPKTGWMVQSFILRRDTLPLNAIGNGKDRAVCGECPFRKGICYVNPLPLNNIWRKYRANEYPHIDDSVLDLLSRRRMNLRLANYGEAVAAPFEVWKPLLDVCPVSLGYTHRWKECDQRWSAHLMASVHTEADLSIANSMGWRCYRTKLPDQPLLPNEIICVHQTDEAITCDSCGLCDGTAKKRTVNIAANVHGLQWKVKNFAKLVK